jgi:RNA polymerase sigma factor (sigma-70 family)
MTIAHTRFAELIRHEGFVQSTLRGLLSEEEARDVLQETWLRVLQRPPAGLREPGVWLARVARNVARSRGRSERRRALREQRAEARAGEDSPAESMARLEGAQRVVSAILALDEPYRGVVLLRYEQDLDTAEIAERLGRSEATVRSQLSRAHALLRTALDREFGGRRRWAVLAAPLAARSMVPLATVAGGLVLVGLTWWGFTALQGERRPGVASATDVLAALEPGVSSVAQATPTRAQREVLTPAALPEASETVQATALAELEVRERLLPVAVLLDRSFYQDYERATFSLQHGLRDDPGNAITRNDWDILFEGGEFFVNTVVDDTSTIADLGRLGADELAGVDLVGRKLVDRIQVEEGHAYFLWTRDSDTDLPGLLLVRKLAPGPERPVRAAAASRRAGTAGGHGERGASTASPSPGAAGMCELDWYATDGTGRGQGSLQGNGAGESLVALLERLRREARGREATLEVPRVLLQARMGAGGGNTNKVHMHGKLQRVDELSRAPLDLWSPIEPGEPSRAYFEGGWIPEGSLFHVRRVTWLGRVPGDGNRSGLFRVVVGGQVLVEKETASEDIAGTWTGDIVLAPGDEQQTYLGIADSSAGEARLEGTLEAGKRVGAFGPNRGFFAAHAPAEDPTASQTMLAPRAVLQARAGARGGNPSTVDLRGKTSIYVNRVALAPLDVTTPPGIQEESLVYLEGGHVPAGQVFVVTRAQWQGSAAGDSNGHGEVKLVVAGEELVDEVDVAQPFSGTWAGALRVVAGEESRTYLEIANSSMADVLLTGYFEPAPR